MTGQPTCRIIPFSKWLITIVMTSPPSGVGLVTNEASPSHG